MLNKPVVAIIGRQNVGKSTLLNHLAGKRIAIVEDWPGTTRDRIAADISWDGVDFTLVDTGGLEMRPGTGINQSVREQAETAMRQADVVIFLVDAKDGLTPTDEEIADLLRRINKPVVLAVNKSDNPKLAAATPEFYSLGMGEPIPISAIQARGTAELLDRAISLLPAPAATPPQTESVKVAIVGRPGVGKSALLNALLGEQRVIVGDSPGTTRDAIDTALDFQGKNVIVIDTAGIRRRGRVERGIEQYSVVRAMEAIDRADITLLVLDTSEPATAQDTHIAGYVQEAAKCVIVVVNKWDLAGERSQSDYGKYVRSKLKFVPYAPVLYVSAKCGQNIDKIMPTVLEVFQERQKRLPTAEVNRVVQKAVAERNPPTIQGKQLKVLYATQTEINPPNFVFFVNDPTLVHFSYRRYLENSLRRAFGFKGTALRFTFKRRRKP